MPRSTCHFGGCHGTTQAHRYWGGKPLPDPPNAAGIDVDSASHFVAVPAERDDEPVREFGSCTADLQRLGDLLKACNVDTVAMECQGITMSNQATRIGR